MCLPPALKKIINNKPSSIDKVQTINKKPKRVSFEQTKKEENKPQVQIQSPVQTIQATIPVDNDSIFIQMFILSQFKENLQSAFKRIEELEKELKESKSREVALMVFYEKHNKKYNEKYVNVSHHYYRHDYDYNDVIQTVV